jgi:AAA domain
MSKCPTRPGNFDDKGAARLKASLQKFCPDYEARKAMLKSFTLDHLQDALIDANLVRDEALGNGQPGAKQETGARELPGLVDAATFIDTPLKSPPELIRGILHQGSKLAFGGGSKSFKTWTLLSLALAVASGAKWLGFKSAQGKVLFINFEIQPYAWRGRIMDVARAAGIKLQPGQVTLWNLRGHAADFRHLIPQIIERCRAENFALIIFDPIYKLYGGADGNKASDVAALLNALEQVAVETGAAIAFGAHFAKGNASGKEAIDRISGSGVFARDPDSLLIFTAHNDEGCFVVEPILRNFPPVKPFGVRWEFPLMQRDENIDPAKLKKRSGRKADYSPADLLKFLPTRGFTTGEWLKAAKGECGMCDKTFYTLKNKLESDSQISKEINQWKRTKANEV